MIKNNQLIGMFSPKGSNFTFGYDNINKILVNEDTYEYTNTLWKDNQLTKFTMKKYYMIK